MQESRKLYEFLKEYYVILEVDENVDDISLKKAYRYASRKHHPDANPNDKQAEERFKKVSEAYIFLKDENNRKLYKTLKEKCENYNKREWEENQSSGFQRDGKTAEKVNKYIFQRRDGSKVEIQTLNKYFINEQTIYKYRIIQYYSNMTIINDLYGRINLSELLKTVEYCDFCVNNLLSRNNINLSIVAFDGYIGYVEMAYCNGRKYYRICDKESIENDNIAMGIFKLKDERNDIKIENLDGYDIFLEKVGKMMIGNKCLNQYVFCQNDIVSYIYSEDIYFSEIKNNKKYHKAIIKKMLSEERGEQKAREGGYVGQLLYNVETDDYDVVIDKEIEKVLNIKQKNRQE